MSNIDKLTYLNETKRQLREAINDCGGNLTQETPFREYARGWLRNQSASLTMDFSKQLYVAKDKAKVSMSHERVGFEDIVTLTRATGGGRFNAQGQYEWVPPNTPRIDYDPVTGECLGLLIEEQRTNLIRDSQPSSGISVGGGGSIQVVPNWFCGRPGILVESSSYVTSGSFWRVTLKEGGTYFVSYFSDVDGSPTIYTGSSYIRATYKERVAPGLWRYGRKFVATGTIGIHFIPGSGAIVGGVQVEEGDFPTSYIPTEGAQVTRAADTASVSELSPWYNSKQGSFSIKSKGHIGEPLLTAGDVSIIGDSDELKEYQVSYSGSPQATQVTMGKGLVESIRYWPREIA